MLSKFTQEIRAIVVSMNFDDRGDASHSMTVRSYRIDGSRWEVHQLLTGFDRNPEAVARVTGERGDGGRRGQSLAS